MFSLRYTCILWAIQISWIKFWKLFWWFCNYCFLKQGYCGHMSCYALMQSSNLCVWRETHITKWDFHSKSFKGDQSQCHDRRLTPQGVLHGNVWTSEWREGCIVRVQLHILALCPGAILPSLISYSQTTISKPSTWDQPFLHFCFHSLPCPLSSDTTPQHQKNDSLRETSTYRDVRMWVLRWQDSQEKHLQGSFWPVGHTVRNSGFALSLTNLEPGLKATLKEN